ncbi:4a-hydroxytetrahydrobiopterin dehydratase [Actinoplanes sp. TFC3]|uniref:4a-hydroxytetrahydrobiopterin dehydratase n=1 Tax=Actinoplanes sp. TFC3 TaxID=1710355 RepID=UPI00082F231C|nr:4a-hydroxytetrahydrobiopterin dehydratase [Actinoplanes sp. TFC3]
MRRGRNLRGTRSDYLSDALAVLGGWTQEGVQLKRVLPCNDSQHADLTERIKVAADTLHVRPRINRTDGHTQILLGTPDGDPITDGDVTLAARIEDAYRTVVGPH